VKDAIVSSLSSADVITNGESYLEHQRELKKLKAENGKS